ncbi:glycosyltransferase [Shewanella sp. NIFS-20-20]|uniref:glycosyltransferase family 2 protein n=1 Tax=Shewanella sp. NIFS-20-20 TaxID=2853806 RepID=UPI00210CBB16|nr:glycosyltransferase family 2 protein [Shewanella sp. NIFS-20-20]
MFDLTTIAFLFLEIKHSLSQDGSVILWFLPLIICFELPLMILVVSGIVRFYYQQHQTTQVNSFFTPKVSCIITCYAEQEAVKTTIASVAEQVYDGDIQIIAVVDGAVANHETYQHACDAAKQYATVNRQIIVLPKWQRGGRVSALNAGLSVANGEIIFNADADTSFDNDSVAQIVSYFADPNVPAVAGALRVRNSNASLVTRMQSIEYLISMQGGKTGLAQWNLVNNISGAFGAFRRELLIQIGGWDTHTAEDLDLTLRFKQYFKRHSEWRIPFATFAVGHTDAPDTLYSLIWQRLRWDGDLFFLYFRKHWPAFSPKLLGMGTFIFTLLYGFLQNVLMPVIIAGYTLYILFSYPFEFVVSMTAFIYCVYLAVLIFLYFIVLLAVSERPKQDLKLLP